MSSRRPTGDPSARDIELQAYYAVGARKGASKARGGKHTPGDEWFAAQNATIEFRKRHPDINANEESAYREGYKYAFKLVAEGYPLPARLRDAPLPYGMEHTQRGRRLSAEPPQKRGPRR